jgi:hypothetical protein
MRLSANAVRLAYSFASESDIRYYLNGVHVEPHPLGGASITGCNGHRLLQVHDQEATDVQDMIINLDKAARKALRKGRYVVTEFEPNRVAIVNSEDVPVYLQYEKYVIEAKYVEVKTVLGERETWVAGLNGFFNVAYIAEATIAVSDALEIGRYDHYTDVTFYSHKPNEGDERPTYQKILFIVGGKTPAWGCAARKTWIH